MDEATLQASFECFGLRPEASMDEVERSFHELRNLYSEESLATYSLLDDAERLEKLESLQTAYDRILQSRLHTPATEIEIEGSEEPLAPESQIVFIDADREKVPGLFLQQMRKARGLSIKDVAERTKVRSSLLQSIEEQCFDDLPAPVYLRGFLRVFARMVKIPDAEAFIDSFMALYQNDK